MPTIRGILSLSLPSFSLLASVGLVVVAVAAVVGVASVVVGGDANVVFVCTKACQHLLGQLLLTLPTLLSLTGPYWALLSLT